MALNTRFKTGGTKTYTELLVTFTTNTPTPSAAQTIANGTVPTVAELGQYVANNQEVMTNLLADVATLKAALDD